PGPGGQVEAAVAGGGARVRGEAAGQQPVEVVLGAGDGGGGGRPSRVIPAKPGKHRQQIAAVHPLAGAPVQLVATADLPSGRAVGYAAAARATTVPASSSTTPFSPDVPRSRPAARVPVTRPPFPRPGCPTPAYPPHAGHAVRSVPRNKRRSPRPGRPVGSC